MTEEIFQTLLKPQFEFKDTPAWVVLHRAATKTFVPYKITDQADVALYIRLGYEIARECREDLETQADANAFAKGLQVEYGY